MRSNEEIHRMLTFLKKVKKVFSRFYHCFFLTVDVCFFLFGLTHKRDWSDAFFCVKNFNLF